MCKMPPDGIMACPPPVSPRPWSEGQEHWWRRRRSGGADVGRSRGSHMWESSYPPLSLFIGTPTSSFLTAILSFTHLRNLLSSLAITLVLSQSMMWFFSLQCSDIADWNVDVSSALLVLLVFLFAVTFSVSL